MNLYSPKVINEIKKRYGFHNSKSLGQNFLIDKSVADAIISAGEITKEDLVVEIGPGMGALTMEAAQRAKEVKAIEIDKAIIPMLSDLLFDFPNVEIVNADVLKTDINELIEQAGYEDAIILGNLPYYITTPIIMALLEGRVKARRIIVMMQKEVAERIKASPGSKIYGVLSLAVQYYCEVYHVTYADKTAFSPVPKVDSEVLSLVPRETPAVSVKDEKLFFSVIKAGFGMRRKTLRNSLASLGLGKETIEKALAASGVKDERRAETLSMEEFASIANFLAD